MRNGLAAVKRAQAVKASQEVVASRAFGSGTLSREEVGALVDTDRVRYLTPYFARFGYNFPKTYEPDCGHCVDRALGLRDGDLSDEELGAALEAKGEYRGIGKGRAAIKQARR